MCITPSAGTWCIFSDFPNFPDEAVRRYKNQPIIFTPLAAPGAKTGCAEHPVKIPIKSYKFKSLLFRKLRQKSGGRLCNLCSLINAVDLSGVIPFLLPVIPELAVVAALNRHPGGIHREKGRRIIDLLRRRHTVQRVID